MNPNEALAILTKVEPVMWLLLLVVLRFAGTLTRSRQMLAEERKSTPEEQPPDYRALKLFALGKWFWSSTYFIFFGGLLPFHLAEKTTRLLYACVSWAVYLFSSIAVVYIMGAILRKALSPLPGLSTAAWAIFRWAAGLAFVIALTAHLPFFGVRNVAKWLDELSISFLLCICMFEISILVLLLTQIRRLGMFLFSRPIGLALGLSTLGVFDVVLGITYNAPPKVALWANISDEVAIIFVVAIWSFYILRREPKRLPHSLSPASRLSKWDDIARRIGVAHKEAEHVPFITTVEALVVTIMDRHKEKPS